MKRFIKAVTIVLSIIMLVTCFGACDWSSDDVNDVVDNAFKNYQSMNSTETGTYSKFKDINVEASYLGYGYDVINDPYMDVKKIAVSYPILDMDKIENINLMMQKVNNGAVDESYGSTMEEFYNDYSASVNVYGKVGKFFSGGLKTEFSGSNSEKNYWYFYKLSYFFDSFYIHITNTVDDLRNYLSETFAYDLVNLPIEQVFDRYGTHLIKEAAMGGRVEKSVTYSSESNTDKTAMNAAVNTHIKAFGASINAEASASANETLSMAQVEYKSKITQLGGKAISLVGDVNYDKWASSFDESLEYATLSGIVSENSLVGIWELLPNGYETRANEMKNTFIELSNGKYDELCDMFKLKDINPDIPGQPANDTIKYAGGDGSIDNPYLIANETHLKNISKNLDNGKYFKLVNDITITDNRWSPLGTNSCKKLQDPNKLSALVEAQGFNGTLDGNGKTISYDLNTDLLFTTNSYDYGFGLFGLVRGATFKNLTINAQLYATKQTNGCANMAGLFAGWAIDTYFENCITTGKVWQDHGGGNEYGCVRSGGFVGIAKNCTFNKCTNNAHVRAGAFYATSGGLVGGNGASRFVNCVNKGKVESNHGKWLFGGDNHGDLYGRI